MTALAVDRFLARPLDEVRRELEGAGPELRVQPYLAPVRAPRGADPAPTRLEAAIDPMAEPASWRVVRVRTALEPSGDGASLQGTVELWVVPADPALVSRLSSIATALSS